jgi:IS30 family transposase
MSHHHLTRDQRSELGAFMVAGLSQVDISVELGVHPSTICRELKRCQTNNRSGYQATVAAFLARQRRARANGLRRKLIRDIPLRRYVTAKLKLDWSPEQISGRLALQYGQPVLSHETIYAWVYRSAPHLKSHLRHGGTQYRRRRGSNKRWLEREKLRRRWIDDRPGIVAMRTRVGDWEGDTMVGTDRKSRLLTCTDRKSGYELAAKLDRVTYAKVADEMVTWFDKLPRTKKHTLTFDNGIEFNQFEYIEATTGLAVYFCHPYSSWERGTNENTNGLLRQYFPKKTSFEFITQDQVDAAVRRLNTRPRKRLGYQTPREVFSRNCVSN